MRPKSSAYTTFGAKLRATQQQKKTTAKRLSLVHRGFIVVLFPLFRRGGTRLCAIFSGRKFRLGMVADLTGNPEVSAQFAEFLRIDCSHQVHHRQLSGFSHKDRHPVDLVAIFEQIDFVPLVAALAEAGYNALPARSGELRANGLNVGLAVLAGGVELKVLDVNSLQVLDHIHQLLESGSSDAFSTPTASCRREPSS